MTALEIHLNGRKVCVAGLAEPGVVSSTITWVVQEDECGEIRLNVGGLFSKTRTFVDWDKRSLSVGDEVRVVICDKKRVSKPKASRTESAAARKKQKLAGLKRLAEEMGYELHKKQA